jgi:hypothetical protein
MVEYRNADNIAVDATLTSRNGTTEVLVVRDGFETDVISLLDSLWKSATGGAVLRGIKAAEGRVLIKPNPGTPNGPVNSEAQMEGLISKIPFEPSVWPSRPDSLNACEVLLHELVHSFRQISGNWDQRPTPDAYRNLEEFYAIVIGNVYRSELRRIGLRGGHGRESLPPAQRDNAAVFLNTGDHLKRLRKLKDDNMDLVTALANVVNAEWNPLRLMMNPPKNSPRPAAALRGRR